MQIVLFLKIISDITRKQSGNKPSLSTMQKIAPDEEVKCSLFKCQLSLECLGLSRVVSTMAGLYNYINCIKLLIIIKATFLKEKYEKFIVNIEVIILNAE